MSHARRRILNVVGARPNFIKIAPLMAAYRTCPVLDPLLLHTGQHYDPRMSDAFFSDLGIPAPDINLNVGSASHAQQTAQIMIAFEQVLVAQKPDAVLVVGDINSTLACGLVAVKMGIQLVHVEAGLRSFDRSMPEEINRVVTDSIADLLLCTEQSGVDNLKREGIPDHKIVLVGNLMIDTLMRNRERAHSLSTILRDLRLEPQNYALLTLHRPANVDDPAVFTRLLDAVEAIQRDLPIVFPVHPRTRNILASTGLAARVAAMPRLKLIDPAGYLDFLNLMSSARVVLSDSGGVQEETAVLRVPCLTLRDTTERPVTGQCGWNRLVGSDPAAITSAFHEAMSVKDFTWRLPPKWDGKAAERIVNVLARAA